MEAGFNPYSGMLINGPQSRADNNVNALADQTANYNSSRAGQWDNSQGFVGVSNPVYGTLRRRARDRRSPRRSDPDIGRWRRCQS